MWDYVPTRLYSAGDVDARRASDPLTDGYDRVDPSPRDQQSTTCAITHLSDVDRKALRTPRGIPRSGGSLSTEGFGRMITIGRLIFVERRSQSDGWRETRIKSSDG